ncbi:MAG: hypothetical protein MK008_01415 [Bdellovibrionales bacterium]|nr:hypothetical protein [Bdellovibrionales bacterium]
MKKLLTILFVIGAGYSVYYSNITNTNAPHKITSESTIEKNNTLKIVSNYNGNPSSNIISNDNKEAFENKLTNYGKIAECLNEENNYCNQFDKEFRENKLFIKNRTHMHREIANTLQQLKNLSEADPEFVGTISASKIIPFLKLTDNRSPVLALELLLEKTLTKEEQDQVIEKVISNSGDNQWLLFKLVLSMDYLNQYQTKNIINSLNEKLDKTKFLYADMQLISHLDNLLLSPEQFDRLSNTLCQRMDELNASEDLKERVYYASKVKCN